MEPSAVKISNLISKSNKADKRFMRTPGALQHKGIRLYEEPDMVAKNAIIVTSTAKNFSFHHLLTYTEI